MTNREIKEKGLRRCKYMDKLGIDISKYGTNFCGATDKRYKKWKKEQKKYGFDSRETWNMDRMLVEWIYTRFKMYLKESKNAIDLNYHKFPYVTKKGKKKEISQKKAIKKVLKCCEEYFKADFIDAQFFQKNIWDLIGEMMPAMWW